MPHQILATIGVIGALGIISGVIISLVAVAKRRSTKFGERLLLVSIIIALTACICEFAPYFSRVLHP